MKWWRETPAWVWATCIVFASLQPATHFLLQACAPPDVVTTGLDRPNGAIFIHSMRMFDTGFYSPYATCHSPVGDHSQLLFPTPFHWMYGVVGAIGYALGISGFSLLGVANGFGVLLYLLSVYHFLRLVIPARAKGGFAIYACLGGLGGPMYLLSWVTGITRSDWFSDWFYRYAIYDLTEGSNLAPYLLAPRLYYTVPMALGFAGLNAFIIARSIKCPYHLTYSWLLLYAASYLNLRFSVPLAAIAAIYAAQFNERPLRETILAVIPLGAGAVCAVLFLLRSPEFITNTSIVVQQAMWLSSFLSAGFPLLVPATYVVLHDASSLPRTMRTFVYTAIGFIALFGILFVCHQIYYGASVRGSDHAAALSVSDFALVGALAGSMYGARKPSRRDGIPDHGWLMVWALVFIALALSAFGGGWFLRFAPQRLMPFIGIPLSVLCAEGLARLRTARPRIARACTALLVACSVSSILVSTLVFQGPFGLRPGLPADLGLKVAYMTKADAACLEHLRDGVVAAPPPFNDILSLRNGTSVIGGAGAVDLADRPSLVLDGALDRFFSMDASREERLVFLQQWCVKFVFLPRDFPRGTEFARELDRVQSLHQIADVDGARLYIVR